jgi:hypothetical protein
MNKFFEDVPPRYVIVYSDRANADLDRLNLFYNRLDPEYAER